MTMISYYRFFLLNSNILEIIMILLVTKRKRIIKIYSTMKASVEDDDEKDEECILYRRIIDTSFVAFHFRNR